MAKWIQPTHDSVKALWFLIRDGRFKSPNGVPKFHCTKGHQNPDELYISWPYDSDSVVRCLIDDIPDFLPDEPQDQLLKVLTRIAKRDLREPKTVSCQAQSSFSAHDLRTAERIFAGKLERCDIDNGHRQRIIKLFRETLETMPRPPAMQQA